MRFGKCLADDVRLLVTDKTNLESLIFILAQTFLDGLSNRLFKSIAVGFNVFQCLGDVVAAGVLPLHHHGHSCKFVQFVFNLIL